MPMLKLSQTKTSHKDKLTEQGNAIYPVEAPMPMLNLSQTKTRHKDKLTEQGNAVYPVEAPMPMLNKLHKQQTT